MESSFKLVSSMKGSREQQGTPLKTKLNVKWASNVYDPPATSLSHTVKNHHQRSRSKKKDHKHKHKGKSSCGSTSEKQHSKHKKGSRSIGNIDTSSSSFQVPHDISTSDSFDQSSLQVLEYAVTGQDSKCGSSFFGTTLAKVNLSVAEAT